MGHQELDTVCIIFTQKLAEDVRLVVLATQADDQHGSGIGMEHHVAQYLFGVLVVVTQLGATIVVRIGHDGIYTFAARFGTQGFGQLVGNAVHAAHGRDDPDFIAYAHVAVLAAVALEGQVPVGNVQVCLYRMVGVFQQAGQIGLYVVFVHPVALSAGFAGMPDGVSVFDDVFTFGQILQCEFMTGRDIFVQGNFLSVYIYFFTCRQRCNGYRYIVCRIDFQELCFHVTGVEC